MGMGLSIVQGILNHLNASVRVQSREGKGTVFFVYFPTVPSEKKAEVVSISALPNGTERILLVDDEAPFTAALSTMLQRLGYRVEAFTQPKEALESFRAHPEHFDLILSDMVMSSLPGDRLIQHAKSVRPEIPAVLMSGYSDRLDLKESRQLLIEAVVRKPVSIKELANRIRNVLDRPKTESTSPA
jgi:CheY-like chemotaxis protein